MVEEKEEKKQERFVLTEVPTAYGAAIQDNVAGEVLGDQQILVEILNKLDRIEKSVSG